MDDPLEVFLWIVAIIILLPKPSPDTCTHAHISILNFIIMLHLDCNRDTQTNSLTSVTHSTSSEVHYMCKKSSVNIVTACNRR